MKARVVIATVLLWGCAGSPPPPDWQINLHGALQAFERHYLRGDGRLAELEFARARAEIAGSARLDLLARAELLRCALRVASLEFDDCPGFEALRRDAAPEDAAYADWVAGRGSQRGAARPDQPIARLVSAGVQMRTGSIAPEAIAAAVETASAQGWRRPLLAWLGVELRRAEQAGQREAADRIRRRMELALKTAGG